MKEEIVQKAKLSKLYFAEHNCFLFKYKARNEKNNWRWTLYKYFTLNIEDQRGWRLFESFSACTTEIERQIRDFPCSIHPYSRVNQGLEIFFCIYILFFTTFYSVVACKPEKLSLYMWCIHLDLVYCLNILRNFFTGYIEGHTKRVVVLKFSKMAKHYIFSWFIIDLLTVILHFPLMFFNHLILDTQYRVFIIAINVLRTLALVTYASNIMESLDIKMSTKTAVETFILVYSYIMWNITFQYEVEYYKENSFSPSSPRKCSWITLANLWDEPAGIKWIFSLNRAVSMMRFNLSMQYIEYAACVEIFMLIWWIVAKILIFHCGFKYIITFFGTESAKAKYFMMIQQVKTYIHHKKLPKNLKNKILKYYNLRFQSHFFVESRMMACVSGQLKQDILVHSGRLVVEDVGFLQQLPRSLLLQVGTKLKVVIFIAGDIIFKINTVGDCLYFIEKGTVAEYSESGRETVHLEDGDYFGDFALALNHKFRITTAVAVTNCELFQLDRDVFESIVTSCPTVYQELRKMALNRLEQLIVLDEQFKNQFVINTEDENITF